MISGYCCAFVFSSNDDSKDFFPPLFSFHLHLGFLFYIGFKNRLFVFLWQRRVPFCFWWSHELFSLPHHHHKKAINKTQSCTPLLPPPRKSSPRRRERIPRRRNARARNRRKRSKTQPSRRYVVAFDLVFFCFFPLSISFVVCCGTMMKMIFRRPTQKCGGPVAREEERRRG